MYRVEDIPNQQNRRLLVQSWTEPQWDVPDGYCIDMGVRSIVSDYDAINNGDTLRFRLHANPTKRVNNPESQWHGKRVDVRDEAEQMAWLVRQGERYGFSLPMVPNTSVPNVHVRPMSKITGKRGDMPLTFGAVAFDGYLIVTNRDALVDALRNGIGSGRAFGFGLMSVASV
jgi:CRISPR system Cascade subunit CasE